MPYAPTVNNTSGQIYGKYVVGAAEAEAEGIVNAAMIRAENKRRDEEAIAQGISQAGQSISKGIGQAVGAKEEADFLSAGYEGQKNMGVPWSAEDDKKFISGSMGTKRAMYSQGQTLASVWIKSQEGQDTLRRQMALSEHNASVNEQSDIRQEARTNATLGRPVATYNAATGEPVAGVQTGRGSLSVIPKAEPPATRSIQTDTGIYQQPTTGGPATPTVDAQGRQLRPPVVANPLASLLGQPSAVITPPGTGTPPPTPGNVAASAKGSYAAAVQALKANPAMAGQFDARYGAGAARRVLGGP